MKLLPGSFLLENSYSTPTKKEGSLKDENSNLNYNHLKFCFKESKLP